MKSTIREWLTKQFGEDESLVKELYSQYRADIAEGLGAVRQIRAAADGEQMRLKAHALKGIALAVGDQETADVCIALQQAGIARDLAQQDAQIAKLAVLVGAMDAE